MTTSIGQVLSSLGQLGDRLREVGQGRRLYLVGGTIRDLLLSREPTDFDFAVAGSGLEFAQAFARRVRGRLVVLSEPDDEARVVVRRRFVFDFNGFGAGTINDDLGRRDFTVNAMAAELTADAVGPVLDPGSGLSDLEARVIRPASDKSLSLDPLRLLRAVRFALELGFTVHESVYAQARSISLGRTAPERIGAEFLRIMEQPGSYPYVLRLQELRFLGQILPELESVLKDPALREHSLKTYQKVEDLISQPGFFGRFEPEWTKYFDAWGVEAVSAAESREQDGRSETPSPLPYRRALLKLAGLLHDVAKPQTKFVNTDGEVHFYGHDSLGAKMVARIARDRLRLSRPQVTMLKTLTAEHMRLHLLATADELTDRAIRRYFRDLGPEALGLMIVCVADGWATAGRTMHLEDTIGRMVNQKREEDAKRSIKRLVTGDDLIELGLVPGPAFKVILEELEELQIEGKIASKEDGIDYLKAHLTGLTTVRD